MSNDVATTTQNANPFAGMRNLSGHVNAGTVAIEQERAVAEAQGKLVIAKKFPRDEARAFSKVMEACSRPALATVAMYAYPRGGQTVSGPSIRMAEELARCWGNLDYGIRELSRREGESEMEAYCWDMETNVISSQKFTVKHIRDRNVGSKALTDERDIYEITANMGGRRLRARILAILPPDLVDAAVSQCRATISGGTEIPVIDRVRKMAHSFNKIGVGADMIEARLGHALDETTLDELTDMIGIFQSLRDGMSSVADWFGANAKTEDKKPQSLASRVPAATKAEPEAPAAATAKPKRQPAATKPDPDPQPEPPARDEPPATDDDWGFGV